MDTRTADELRNLQRSVAELQSKVARLPVRDGKVRSGPIKVLITSSVSAADYSMSGTLTPSSFTARLWLPDGSGGYTHSSGATKACTNPYATDVSVGSGKGRVAWVTAGGELIAADCTEITL